ncbi:siderophore-interacting protein [Leucobacter massiliensis]|uniref:NADPH-dependent ferric siderophore reductase n=1 Tax=Leucobacter massiliensis TaxID=1686285 RepID=A0A2S9QRT4_9MICO|nr:siderophore-interacting protein [Leucobacter massiliensis]PRI12300.1 NADPH-dependent ferric siderophore reductase [Leucobacter massiliensis]
MSVTEAAPSPAELFARPRTMHRFTARRVTVTAVVEIEHFTRVTLSGEELGDWASIGPGDHARVFFPDPETGELIAPAPLGPEESGIVRPDGPAFGRDFTPLNVRTVSGSGHRAFDIDILRHADPGPAAAWATRAAPGEELVIVGPRGSVSVAAAAPRVLCVADASALPATARWIAEMPSGARIEVIADVDDPNWVRAYLAAQGGRDVPVSAARAEPDGLATAAREAGIDAGTYVFAAGEANRLIPLRRLLRYELGLPREQYAITGYWRRGDAAFDHHAPIDPADPDD